MLTYFFAIFENNDLTLSSFKHKIGVGLGGFVVRRKA